MKIALVLALSLCAQAARAEDSCSNWPAIQWNAYIDVQVLSPLSPYKVESKLKSLDQKCPESSAKPWVKACLARISGYYANFSSHRGMFTDRMSDDEYYALQPADEMTLPPELQAAHNALPQNWREVAKKNRWKYALFHSGTANESRLVIYLPGEKYNRLVVYYAFGQGNNDPTTYAGLQMQAIEKTPPGSQAPAKYWFRSWGFNGPNNTPVPNHSGGHCVTCHISGPRAVVPLANADFPTELGNVSSLEQFNSLVVHDGPLDYSPYYDLKNFPTHLHVGSTSCAFCHDGGTRNSLAHSVDSGGFFVENLYRKVVTEQTMPPGSKLSHQERIALVNQVAGEYDAALKSWLTETRCVDPSQVKSGDDLPRAAPARTQ